MPASGSIGVVNLVRNDFVPELSMALEQPVRGGQLIINLRAEAAPACSWDGGATRRWRQRPGKFATLRATLEHLEQFRPGKPTPTHRFEKVAA